MKNFMKDNKIKKAIGEIKKITMTFAEKKMVLERVMENASVKVDAPFVETDITLSQTTIYTNKTKSPWNIYSFGNWVQDHRWISSVSIFLIVILAGNSAAWASFGTLPGDIFYPVKVSIVEPLRIAFASTPFLKAEIQTRFVQDRLQESETLAARGLLDMKKEKDLNQRIEKQVAALAINVDGVKVTSPEEADDLNTTLEASINTHERLLDVISASRGEVRVAANAKENNNSAVSVTMMVSSPSTDSVSPASAKQAAPAVSPIRSPQAAAQSLENKPNNLEIKKIDTKNINTNSNITNNESSDNSRYSVKKTSVESLIRTTTADLQASSTPPVSTMKQTITNDARTNLDRAQDKLQEAKVHNTNGEANQAYSSLMESERSTKEAGMLIEAGVRLEKENKQEEIKKVEEVKKVEESKGAENNGKKKGK